MGLVKQMTKIAAAALLVSTTLLVACGKNDGGGGKSTSGGGKIVNVPSPNKCLNGSAIQTGTPSYNLYNQNGFRTASFNISFGVGLYSDPYAQYGYGYNPYGGYYGGGYGGGYGGYGYGGYGGYGGYYGGGYPYGSGYGTNIGGYNSGWNNGTGSGSMNCGCSSYEVPACDNNVGLTCVSMDTVGGLNRPFAIYNYNGKDAFTFDNYYSASSWQTGTSSNCRMAQACVVGTANTCGYGTCVAVGSNSTIGVCVQ